MYQIKVKHGAAVSSLSDDWQARKLRRQFQSIFDSGKRSSSLRPKKPTLFRNVTVQLFIRSSPANDTNTNVVYSQAFVRRSCYLLGDRRVRIKSILDYKNAADMSVSVCVASRSNLSFSLWRPCTTTAYVKRKMTPNTARRTRFHG